MHKSISILGTRGVPAQYGGFETFADVIGQRLVRAGHRVVVTCERRPGEPVGPPEHAGITLVHVAAPRLGPLSTIVHDMLCLWRLRRETDVVYLLGYGAALFAFLPRLCGREVWINPDGVEWQRGKWNLLARTWFKLMEWVTMRVASRVIADADALQNHLVSRHTTRVPVEIIAYGTDVIPVAQEPAPDDIAMLAEHGLKPRDYFLVICRLEPENHILEIIRGYLDSGVVDPLVIFGNHRRETSYVRALCAEGRDSRIRFMGVDFDAERLSGWRSHCRAYVHGHSVGGTNPSLLEALGAGSAVLAHDNAFNREVLGDVDAAWFHDKPSVTAAFKEISTLAPELLQQRRHDARARASEHYNWDDIAQRYGRLLGAADETGREVTPSPRSRAGQSPHVAAPKRAPLDQA